MRDMQKILGALTSPVRREILALIWEAALPAGDIAAAFNLTAPTISQHLSVLREAGLVTVAVEGTFRRYRAQQEVLNGLRAALGDSVRWTPADDLPEQHLAAAQTQLAVVAEVDVDTDQPTTFSAVTDPAIYSRWLGVPVTIVEGVFACTMEFGTVVRGHYDVVHPPELLAMRWDFEDDNVPLPGGDHVAYMRIRPRDTGAHVAVHQLVETREQADFMDVAWRMILGRLKEGVVAASDAAVPVSRRSTRPKRRRSA